MNKFKIFNENHLAVLPVIV